MICAEPSPESRLFGGLNIRAEGLDIQI